MVRFKRSGGSSTPSPDRTPHAPPTPTSVPQELIDEIDEIDELDIEDDEERDTFAVEDFPDTEAWRDKPIDGPGTWEEVDTEELARIALHICSNTVPSTDHAEAASRLAMQAASLDTDTLDLLALGRIDTRQLRLVKIQPNQGRPAGLMRLASSVGPQLTRMSSRRLTQDMQKIHEMNDPRRAGPVGHDAAKLAALRNKVLPASQNFDALLYLSTIHAETALEELEAGREALRAAGSERAGQLKALVKQNFDRFISCKTTIDDVHSRLRAAEVGLVSGSTAGASTGDVVATIAKAQEEAQKVFADVLDRAAECERRRSSLALLKQYDSLFRLPPRIRDATRRADHEQVISDYRTAKALLPDMGRASQDSVWYSLIEEVEKGVEEMAANLIQRLKSPRTGLPEATEAISALLQLQAEGARCAQSLDPVKLFINTLSVGTQEAVATCMAQHQQRIVEASGLVSEDSLKETGWQPQQPGKGPGLNPTQQFDRMLRKLLGRAGSEAATQSAHLNKGVEPSAGSTTDLEGPTEADIPVLGNEGLWLELISSLTSMLVRHLPSFWQLPQARLPALAFISHAAKQAVEAGSDTAVAIVNTLLLQYSERVNSAIAQLATAQADKAVFLSAVRRVVTGFTALRAANAPQLLASALDKILEAAAEQAVGQMVAERAQLLEQLPSLEDWQPRQVLVGTNSAPISATPARLRSALHAGMAQVAAVMTEASRADYEKHEFNPLGASADGLRHAFYDAFTTFAVAADTLLASAPALDPLDAALDNIDPNASLSTAPQQSSSNRRTLLLLANCGHVRSGLMLELAAKFRELLAADGQGDAVDALQVEASQHIKQVEARLTKSYQESKAVELERELEEYLHGDGADWATCPLPASMRDSAIELLNALVEVEAEVYSGAPELHLEVMTNLVTHLLTRLSELLLEQLEGVGLGGALQLLLELQFLEGALPTYTTQPAIQDLLGNLQEALIDVIQARAGSLHSKQHTELERWVGKAQGLQLAERLLNKSDEVAVKAMVAVQVNIACFQEAHA